MKVSCREIYDALCKVDVELNDIGCPSTDIAGAVHGLRPLAAMDYQIDLPVHVRVDLWDGSIQEVFPVDISAEVREYSDDVIGESDLPATRDEHGEQYILLFERTTADLGREDD